MPYIRHKFRYIIPLDNASKGSDMCTIVNFDLNILLSNSSKGLHVTVK